MVLTGFLGGAACDRTPKETLEEANLHLWQGRTEGAIALYEEVLRRDPGNVEAHRGLAISHAARGDSTRQEAYLLRALALGGLPPEERRYFEDQLDRLYLARAEALREAPASVRLETLRKALLHNPGSRASAEMATVLTAEADRLLREGKVGEAAAALEEVAALALPEAERKGAARRADDLRLGLLRDELARSMAGDVGARLAAASAWDPKRRRFLLRAEVRPDSQADPADPELWARLKAEASLVARHRFLALLAEVLGLPLPKEWPETLASSSPASFRVERAVRVRRPERLFLDASVDFEDGVRLAHLLRKALAGSTTRGGTAGRGVAPAGN